MKREAKQLEKKGQTARSKIVKVASPSAVKAASPRAVKAASPSAVKVASPNATGASAPEDEDVHARARVCVRVHVLNMCMHLHVPHAPRGARHPACSTRRMRAYT